MNYCDGKQVLLRLYKQFLLLGSKQLGMNQYVAFPI